MGIARLTHTSKVPPSQKVGVLTKYKESFQKLLTLSVTELYPSLKIISDKVTPEHKAMARTVFKDLEVILNSLASIEALEPEERQEYAKDISVTYSEVLEKISSIMLGLDVAITKFRHMLETNVNRATDKDIDPDLEDDSEISVSGIKSMDDLKEAFAKLERKKEAKDKKERAALRKQPVKEDTTDFESKSLSVLEKYSKKKKEAPRNEMDRKMSGVFESPVLIKGMFNFSSITSVDLIIQNIGSGFYLFEHLPVVYVSTNYEDPLTEAREVLKKLEKSSGVKYAFPDAKMTFRDRNSPNLEFRVAMPVLTINMLSPFKSIEQAAFPWATKTVKTGAPKHKSGELEEFIQDHARMVEFMELGRMVMRRNSTATKALDELNNKKMQRQSELKELNAKTEGARARGNPREIAHAEFETSKLELVIEHLNDEIVKYSNRKSKSASKMRSMRAEKAALIKELREEYVSGLKTTNRRRPRNRQSKRSK